mgnify:CR=1 FL=1|tara:strand:- start:1811 stop:2425 length:615 start_codon:yes stop_codon:yes gene_type:complete
MPITINGAGTITGVSIGGLPDGIVDTDMLANNAVTAAKRGAGAILQVVQNHVTGTSSQSLSQNAVTNITNLNVSITPKASTSDMLIYVMWHGELADTPHNTVFGLKRNTTAIGNAASSGNRSTGIGNINIGYGGDDDASTIDSAKYQFFDTGRPSGTSQITYHATIVNRHSGGITLVNGRTVSNANSPGYELCPCSITIFEVAT